MAIGFDCGTYNLVCCKRDENNNFVYKREVNAFIEIPMKDRFVFNMMKNAVDENGQPCVPLIEVKDAGVAYALGEAAMRIAYSVPNLQVKRPMHDGCLNPKEKHAQQIMSIMVHSLIDSTKDKDLLYYSIPANAINQETDADYHSLVLKSMFDAFKDENNCTVVANPINEGLALVYAELAKKAYTGIGVSCLCPGTKIYTNNGIVNIENVKIGDLVLTHKGRWRAITNIITKNFEGINTKLQISGYSNNTNEYSFVDDHELYVFRNGEWKWIGCESIIEGDIVGEPFEKEDKNSTPITMTICDRVTCSKVLNKKHIEVTSDVLRLIGYFLANGSVNLAEGCIQFDFQNSEKDNINDVQEILIKNFHKESSLTKHGDNCTRIKCYSKGMANYFKNKFHHHDEKIFPWKLEKLSKGQCINLLAGLIRGDGVLGEKAINFRNSNTRLIHLSRRLFSRLGIATSISHRESRESFICDRLVSGKHEEWCVSSGSKTTLESISDIIKNISCENSNFLEKIFIIDNMCCGRIQKIEHMEYSGIVYDLQVEDDHSFSGPFLTIHNCGAGMVNLCFSVFGSPVFQFAIVNSGDWIDRQAAKATGESESYINREKMKVDLTANSDNLVQRAIKAQYELMIQKTVNGIKKGLDEAGKIRAEHPIDIVIAGGTSSPTGFDQLFSDAIRKTNLPIEIGNIIRPSDPLYSVARGCLLAAEAADQG